MPDKPLAWLHGEIRTPPFSAEARLEAGYLLRRLQQGESLGMPHSRSLPAIAPRCHELRVRDEGHNWRVFYRVDPDAIVILGVYDKRSRQLPGWVIEGCKARARRYDQDVRGGRR